MRTGIRILGSGWTTTLLLGLMAFAYALAGVWGDPVALMSLFLKQNPIGLALYLLLISSLLLSAVNSTRDIYGHGHTLAEDVRRMDDHIVLRDKGFEPDKWMISKGLSPRKTENGYIAHKGRLSFVPGLMLKAGLLVLLLALPTSGSLRQVTDVVISPGESAEAHGHEISLIVLKAPLPEEFLHVAAEGEGTTLELSGLEAKLETDGKEITLREGTPGNTGGLGLRMTYLGYRMQVRSDPSDKPDTLAYLDALPPGRSCEPVSGLAVSLLPERTVKRGLLSGSLYNLKRPLFKIISSEGEYSLRAGEVSRDGKVELGESSLYIELEVRRDAALPFIKAGLVLFVLGIMLMPLRMFWYGMRVAAVRDGDSVIIGQADELFKAWGMERFREITEELLTSEDSLNEKP